MDIDTPTTKITPVPAAPEPVALPTQEQIEATPEFKVWADSKKNEAKAYVFDAFGLQVNFDDLLVWRDDAGWPDPIGRAGAYKTIVSNQKFRDSSGATLGNYNVWRKLPVISDSLPA
jgi:hypothetical protein